MGPPALQRELEQRRRRLAAASLDDLVGGPGRLAGGGDRHLGRRAGGAPDRRLDLPALPGHIAHDQRQIPALHRPRGQLFHERVVGLRRPRHRQEARGALVEPVHDSGPVGRADPRRHEIGQVWEAGQQSSDQGPDVVARPRVHDEPRRLVHHRHQIVGVHDLEAHVGLRRHTFVSDLGQQHTERGSLSQRGAPSRDPSPVDQHPPGRDQLGGRSPRDVGHHGDPSIRPNAGQQCRDDGRHRLADTDTDTDADADADTDAEAESRGRPTRGAPTVATMAQRARSVRHPALRARPASPAEPAGTGSGPAKSRLTMTMTTPTVTHASARLKVGQ